jgi:hypothetical protein
MLADLLVAQVSVGVTFVMALATSAITMLRSGRLSGVIKAVQASCRDTITVLRLTQ